MEMFKRINKNSKIAYSKGLNVEEILDAEEKGFLILQIVKIDDFYIMEYITKEEEQQPISDKPCVPEQKVDYYYNDLEYENSLNTIINCDPFGAKYSHRPIKDIFEAGDVEWLDKALKYMNNKFIRDKLEFILKRGGYGQIKR